MISINKGLVPRDTQSQLKKILYFVNGIDLTENDKAIFIECFTPETDKIVRLVIKDLKIV